MGKINKFLVIACCLIMIASLSIGGEARGCWGQELSERVDTVSGSSGSGDGSRGGGGGGSGSSGDGGGTVTQATGGWARQTPSGAGGLPVGRRSHGMVWDGIRVIMFGGYDGANNRNDLWWYGPSANTWTQMRLNGAAGSPSARQAFTMVWDGTRVIMFGGSTGAAFPNDLWWYNPNTNTWTQQIADGVATSPIGRFNASMAWDGTRAILFGGQDIWETFLNDVWAYNPNTNSWTQLSAQGAAGSPSARTGHTLVSNGSGILLFGGLGPLTSYRNDLWLYDTVGNSWSELIPNGAANSPNARLFHSMSWCGSQGIMFGGSLPGLRNDLWICSSGGSWTQRISNGAATSPAVRERAGMVWDGSKIIMFGGEGDNSNELSDTWWFITQ
ncbi:MAG: hypothetical protein HY811_03775 [Planctomycetes bacterium]|nr:hypothetical protein [Planctomycetota bacterium]